MPLVNQIITSLIQQNKMCVFSENRFSGKIYFYTIAHRQILPAVERVRVQHERRLRRHPRRRRLLRRPTRLRGRIEADSCAQVNNLLGRLFLYTLHSTHKNTSHLHYNHYGSQGMYEKVDKLYPLNFSTFELFLSL